ncbi:transcription elongation factor 1 homolog [Oncorhynchus keta]|uniref:transcription elongation factor 1 homolog n=1 Tax=Oncorhynchus keta TaxID=8018 RepID=UPI0015FDC609|nr:transcription elongation factor 1 homolog [Oncorhynchus keta]
MTTLKNALIFQSDERIQNNFRIQFLFVSVITWVIYLIYTSTMGRRKSKRKPPPKKKLTGNLDTQFTCPFCNHEKSCDVKMERTRNTGIISCTVCLEEFQTPITYLSEPVDVYSDWIDACEAANQ